MKKEFKQNQLSKNGLVSKVVAVGTVTVAGTTNAMAAATLTAPTFALDDVSVVAVAFGKRSGLEAVPEGICVCE